MANATREAQRRYDRKPEVNRRKAAARQVKRYPHSCDSCGTDMLVSYEQRRNVRRGITKSLRCEACRPNAGPVDRCVVPWVECGWCGHLIVGRNGRRYCSSRCRDWSSLAQRGRDRSPVTYAECRRCGSTFVRRAGRVGGFCTERCAKRARKSARKHTARTNGPSEKFTLREIAERDGWCCHICGRQVPDRDYLARPNDPTIDHLIPVSDGGLHVRSNVALAHNRCNYERGAGGVAQLLLVG